MRRIPCFLLSSSFNILHFIYTFIWIVIGLTLPLRLSCDDEFLFYTHVSTLSNMPSKLITKLLFTSLFSPCCPWMDLLFSICDADYIHPFVNVSVCVRAMPSIKWLQNEKETLNKSPFCPASSKAKAKQKKNVTRKRFKNFNHTRRS